MRIRLLAASSAGPARRAPALKERTVGWIGGVCFEGAGCFKLAQRPIGMMVSWWFLVPGPGLQADESGWSGLLPGLCVLSFMVVKSTRCNYGLFR